MGRWEGDTLVVDTIGIKENVRFQNVPHSQADANPRADEACVADGAVERDHDRGSRDAREAVDRYLRVSRMPNYTLLEYICEDNREYADEKGLQKIRSRINC